MTTARPAFASVLPPANPIYLTPTNQAQYGFSIEVEVHKVESPGSFDENTGIDNKPEEKSCRVSITAPVGNGEDKLTTMHLHARDPNFCLTIPLKYTEFKHTISHPDLKPDVWVSKENTFPRASLLIPEEWLARHSVHINYWNNVFIVHPELFLEKERKTDE